MKRRLMFSVRKAAKRLADSISHNFALKLLSLLLSTMIYLMLKPNAVTTTPAVEKMAKAIAVGAGMEKPAEPVTNEVSVVTAPTTNMTSTVEVPALKTDGASAADTNGKN